MKALPALILSGALLPMAPAQAETPATRAEVFAFCKEVAGAARKLMAARQGGVPMVELMELAGDNTLLQDMVKSAFAIPAFSTDSIKQRQITEFENTHYAACLEHAPRK